MITWLTQLLLVAGSITTGVQTTTAYVQQLPPAPDQSAITCHAAEWENTHLASFKGFKVNKAWLPLLGKLFTDSEQSGFNLMITSAYRTCGEQASLRAYACGTGDYNMNIKPIKDCSPPTEPAGKSLHNEGLAIDLACAGYGFFESSPCYIWLKANHLRYALIEHELEPWHWSTTGK